MGLAIVATLIASAVTSGQVQELKKQINYLISKHQQVSKKSQQIIQELKKLDLKEISLKLELMNQNLANNLKNIISDQQTKIGMISQIDIKKILENPKTLLANIVDVLNVIGNIALAISIMCSTNPATIAISGILLTASSILSIFNIINNIQDIQHLSERKAQLEQYFKSGGPFEQDIKQITRLSYQVVENFYIFVVNFKSLINQLAININLLSISKKSRNLDYAYYLNLIKSNPFDQEFEKECFLTYKNFTRIQDYDIDQKVNMSCKYLEAFQSRNNVIVKIQLAGQIASNFTKDSEIGKQLQRASSQFIKLTTLKERFLKKFEKRKERSREELHAFDKDLLEDLMQEARKMEEKQLSVVEVVSFFTTEFFADDSTGRTLFKMDLQQIYAKTELLGYLGVASNGLNLFYLPEPEDQALRKEWNLNKNFLQEEYRKANPQSQYQVRSYYIRMQVAPLQLNGQNKSRLKYYKGIQGMHKDSFKVFKFEKEISQMPGMRFTQYSNMEDQVSKIEKMEESDQDLQSLCNYLCFYINGIAYPERILSFNVTKQENLYKAVVEWSHDMIKPEFFGKTIEYILEELKEVEGKKEISETKQKVFHTQLIEEDKSEVVFRTK